MKTMALFHMTTTARVRGALLSALAVGAVALAGCGDSSPTDKLLGGDSRSPDSLAAGTNNTQHHFQDPNTGDNGITDPNQVKAADQAVGTPEVVARLHACTKITYASLGSILSSRGVNIASTSPSSAGQIYNAGRASLGVANYAGRVPEALTSSTASLSKQMDIFVAAAQEIPASTALGATTGCPGVTILDMTGKFTSDGVSCLLGKPASDAHVTLANQLVTEAPDPATGQKIAIAALLEAAHTCE